MGTIETASYWALRDRPLQHLLTFAGLAISIGVAIAWAGGEGGLIGLTLWLLGAALTLVACGVVGAQVEWLAPLLGGNSDVPR